MEQLIVETKNMTKTYGKQSVVKDLNIRVQKGAIYGFIGLNGAGKSTCIRLISGLTDPTEGVVQLFGTADKNEVNRARKRIGTMIEAPALYPHMTARQNLEVIRIARGIPGKECIETTLKRVDLEDTGKKKVSTFSLGMKQRLGIAIALLSSPELLILDEPINGLDPIGVIKMRQLLQRLNQEYGVTIIISSHILTEVHQIATHYGIIHQGKLIEQCTRKEIDDKCQSYIRLRVSDVAKAVTIFEERLGTTHFEVVEDGSIKLYTHIDEPAVVSQLLHENDVLVEQLSPQSGTLESYFTSLIKEGSK